MSRRPVLRTSLPGPKAKEAIARSEATTSPSYTRDYPLVADHAHGCWITDPDGNEFLDMTAGIAVCATGHTHEKVVAAIQKQAAELIHMSGTDFYYEVQAQIADRIANSRAVRGEKARVYFGNSGAEANEAAMKLARYHTGRQRFIAFLGAFHGRTYGALSLTGSKIRQRERFGPLLPGVTHAVYPDPLRHGGDEAATRFAMGHLHELFRTTVPPEEVAAIFVEPIQGEGGYIVPPDQFLRELRALCDQHGILLVYDEVQSGMGRTGKLWAWHHAGEDTAPDILTCAKGIASGMPLSAMVATDKVMKWLPGSHASTFGGNPVCCAAAVATYDLLQDGLIDNAAKVGAFLQNTLRESVGDHPAVADVRGRGLMIAVELVKDKKSLARASELRNQIVLDAFEAGLLLLGCGPNCVRFCPALVLNEDEAVVATQIFTDVLRAAAA